MAIETIYVVQTWVPGKRDHSQADKPLAFTSEDAAVRRAYRLEEEKLGVLVFAQAGDAETGDYDEPRIILRLGEVEELE